MTAIAPPQGIIKSGDGRIFKFVSGTIRNAGATDYWQPLSTSGHDPVNIDSVTTSSSAITINYPGIAATKVVSFLIVPDETLAAQGFFCGASVAADNAVVTLARVKEIQDLVYYDGAAWATAKGSSPYTPSFSAGKLTLTHTSISISSDPSIAIANRSSAYRAVVSADVGGWSDTKVVIEFYNAAGNLVQAADTNMAVFVTRMINATYNPQNVTTSSYPNSNLWFFGIFE